MSILSAFVVGLVFGLGLILSGMSNPAKVLGFLDLAGPWDPSLALVMAGAVLVGLVGFAVARRRTVTWLGAPLRLPQSSVIDKRLVVGGLVFGAGWGLAGFCPGPALVALGMGAGKAVVFVVAMIVGMAVHELVEARGHRQAVDASRGEAPSTAEAAPLGDA